MKQKSYSYKTTLAEVENWIKDLSIPDAPEGSKIHVQRGVPAKDIKGKISEARYEKASFTLAQLQKLKEKLEAQEKARSTKKSKLVKNEESRDTAD